MLHAVALFATTFRAALKRKLACPVNCLVDSCDGLRASKKDVRNDKRLSEEKRSMADAEMIGLTSTEMEEEEEEEEEEEVMGGSISAITPCKIVS